MRSVLLCFFSALPLAAQLHPDPVLARMVPDGTVTLVGARMDQLKETPLYLKLIAQQKLPQLDEFARNTGFDPRRDVRELLLASNPRQNSGVLLARGSFRIAQFGNLKTWKHGIYVIYGSDQAGFCILDSTTAAAGPLERLYAALDHWHDRKPLAVPALLSTAEKFPSNAQLWAVSDGGFNFGNFRAGNGIDFGRIFQGVQQVRFWADLRAGLNARLDGDVKTEADAKNLADAARGLIGLGRLSVPENHTELLKLWDNFKVDQAANNISIAANVPQDQIDHLADLIQSGEIGPGARPPGKSN